MQTFAEKSSVPAHSARSVFADPNRDTVQGFELGLESTPMNPLQAKLNQTSSVAIQMKLQDSFSQSPRLVAQAKLGEKLAQRKASIQAKCDMCEVSESEEKLKKLKKESDPGEDEDDTVIQSKAVDNPASPETPVPAANNTGLPDNLKTGIESLSGMSLDDVNVHYNSSQPAQLQALAYTQGTDIHVGPGQEQHLAHEAWHVVQQKQGRVQPTTQLQNVAINDDFGLEREADVMGGKALQRKNALTENPQPAKSSISSSSLAVVQRVKFDSINKDIEPGDLTEHDFTKYSTAKLNSLLSELQEKAKSDEQNAGAYNSASETVKKIIQERIVKEEESRKQLQEYQYRVEELEKLSDGANFDAGRIRGQINLNLDFLFNFYKDNQNIGFGFESLFKKIKQGRDGWDSEAAPYMRELFLGLSELGRGGVQFGAKGGVGGDVVTGLGTDEVTTIQSKYFTGESLHNVESDIQKGIEQLGGKYGETPVPNSTLVVDTVVANPNLASQFSLELVNKLVEEALTQATKSLDLPRQELPIHQILIALPTKRVQFRIAIHQGMIQSIIPIEINPMRFDLPELHTTSDGNSIKDLFKEVEAIQGFLLQKRQELEKLKSIISSIQEKIEKIHADAEEDEDGGGFGFGFGDY